MASNINLGDHAKKVHTFFGEFKKFALRGNVVDLAVGVIIGAAFGNIVKSLVDNVFMPLLGMMLPGDKGYEAWTIGQIAIGKFIGAVINFVIVAFILYLFIVKFLGWIMRTKDADPPAPTKDQELLMEIRDLLKARSV
jgi:large conductance mechanosensitive channel